MSTQNDDRFDFNGFKKEEPVIKPPSRYENFLKMGASGLAATALVLGMVYAGYSFHQKNIEQQNQEISQKETAFKGGPVGAIKNAISSEKEQASSQFAKNQILLSRYGQYPDLVKLLQLNSNLANNMKNNSIFLKQTNDKLDTDLKKITELESASTRDDKVSAYLDKDNFSVFSKWSKNVADKKSGYLEPLEGLNKTLTNDLTLMENTKNEIMNKVKERIKAKDFDLDKAQSQFSGQVSNEKNKELNDFTQIKDQLAGSDEEAQFNNSDLAQAQTQLAEIETETNNQIKQDRQAIEKLIAETNPAQTAAAQPAQQTQQNSSSNNFATYMLMYHWMNAGSTSAAYQSGLSAGTNAALARQAPYTMASNVTSSRIQAYKSQISSRATTARSTISRGGFGRSGGFSSGG